MSEYVGWGAASHVVLAPRYITVMEALSLDWWIKALGCELRIFSYSRLLRNCIVMVSTRWTVRLGYGAGKPCSAHKSIGFAGYPNSWDLMCSLKRVS